MPFTNVKIVPADDAKMTFCASSVYSTRDQRTLSRALMSVVKKAHNIV